MSVVLDSVTKRYPGHVAVRQLSLSVRENEFFCLLGPSGCGKTTTLRMVAGFESPDEGRIWLEGQPVEAIPPYRRSVNTVFQSYALFEHLDVAGNIAFGLKRQKVAKPEIERRVGSAMELVRLSGRSRARPAELSGGERQRVALARALVNRPGVLLLDEPLGALDLKLRREMQVELSQIQAEIGITFVYVTHDQEEAFTMSDRLAVMRAGRIEQLGSPHDLYERPANAFVADFVGLSNLIDGTLERDGVRLRDGALCPVAAPPGLAPGQPVQLAVRPERIRLGPGEEASVALRGRFVAQRYLGTTTQLLLDLEDGTRLVVASSNGQLGCAGSTAGVGDTIEASFRPADAVALPQDAP